MWKKFEDWVRPVHVGFVLFVGIVTTGYQVGRTANKIDDLATATEMHAELTGHPQMERWVGRLEREIQGLSVVVQTQLCLELADRNNANWRECLVTP